MSESSFHIQIRRKGNWFLASAPELDFISQGQTIEEARKNLLEVIRIQFEEMREMGTLQEYLTECGDVTGGILRASSEGTIHNLNKLPDEELIKLLDDIRFLKLKSLPDYEMDARFVSALETARQIARQEGITGREIQEEVEA